jgi:hypothetical protein
MKNISRVKNENVKAWRVRISRGKRRVDKCFADCFYGNDSKLSLEAAQKYRDKTIAELPARTGGRRQR